MLAIGLLNVVLVWCVAGAAIWQSYRDAIADARHQAQILSLTTASYTQQALAATDLLLRSMIDWIADEEVRTEEQFVKVAGDRRFHDSMRERIVGLPQISVASVVDRNGNLLTSSLGWPVSPANIVRGDALRAQLGSNPPPLSLSNAIIGINTKRWTFFFLRRMKSSSDELLGVAIVGVDAEYFANLFRSITVGEDSTVSLFKVDGNLLATTIDKPGLMGQTFQNAAPVRLVRKGLSGTSELSQEPRWWDATNAGDSIVAARQVEGFPILVAVTIGEKAFLNQWRPRLYFIATLGLLVSAVAALLTGQFLRMGVRSESAARLASERRLLAALVDTPVALCAVLDSEGRTIYSNERFRDVVSAGRDPQNVLRNPAVRGGERLLAFASGNETQQIEVDVETTWPGQPTRYLHFSVSRQTLADVGACTILVGHDETPRHQAQRAIAQTSKLVTLGEMTTGMAHELSQPLNVIRMAAQNALSEVSPADHRGSDDDPPPMSDADFRRFMAGKLDRIVAQVDRAASIIARMRVFGRTPEGPPAVIDVRDACQEALTLVGQRLRNHGIAIREEYGSAPLRVRSHLNLLEQVLVNLLLNARDALQSSRRNDKEIVISGRVEAGHVLLTVADNGPGVPPEARERLFEPFFTSKPTGQGTGLGLALSFGIVREAGGTLSLLSGDGGAIFQIDLPEASANGRG